MATLKLTKPGTKAHEKRMEKLAIELRKYLLERRMWTDTAIYFNGKRFDSYPVYQSEDGEISEEPRSGWKNVNYNNPDFLHVKEGVTGRQFTEYGNDDTIIMTFEGALYECLNYGTYDGIGKPWQVQTELEEIFNKYGYYSELGHAWSLSLYEN